MSDEQKTEIQKRLEESAAAWPHHKEQLLLSGRPGALAFIEEQFKLLNARIAELEAEKKAEQEAKKSADPTPE
jgi:hypothetical protein